MTIKLRELRASGFRGARFDLTIDFTADRRSLALFGENASGKSTVTDAVEWFLTGRVDHLWKEDCRESALRNVMIGNQDDSEVEMNFGQAGSSIKRLLPNLTKAESNDSIDFKLLVGQIANERVYLRHADIVAFILETKNKKRDEIESIIGFEALRKFRETIRLCRTRLENEQDYLVAKNLKSTAEAEIFVLTGKQIATNEALFESINAILAPFDIGFAVTSPQTVSDARHKLKSGIADPKRAEKKVQFDQLAKDAHSVPQLVDDIAALRSTFEAAYSVLFEDKDSIAKIRLESFLRSGLKIVNDSEYSLEACPFCLKEQDLEKLKLAVESRMSEIADLRAKYADADTRRAALIASIDRLSGHLVHMAETHGDLGVAANFFKPAKTWSADLKAESMELKQRFAVLEPIQFAAQIWKQLVEISDESANSEEAASNASEELQLTEQETQVIEAYEAIGRLAKEFDQQLANGAIARAFQQQILALDSIYTKFIDAQNDAMQEALDAISKDVSQFYSELHPTENVDNVRLRIVGEQGVEFEYSFHGHLVYPPRKYLSESHLNSLGIVLFLSSARLLNKECRFLVLDDIVTSFDYGHRRRLLRLLGKHFSDWQIILLTHESFWYEMIKKEMGPSGWLFEDVQFDDENGIMLSSSPADLRGLIKIKRKEYDVSNDLRKLLEAELKAICLQLKVRVPFRFNDANERRMPDELLSDLQSTINRKKCTQLKGHEIFSKLKASNLVANIGSHDNPEQISGGDIDVALEDIDVLVGLFQCVECDRFVSAGHVVPGKNRISCQCGNKQIDWN